MRGCESGCVSTSCCVCSRPAQIRCEWPPADAGPEPPRQAGAGEVARDAG
jgi:hypothetical protein